MYVYIIFHINYGMNWSLIRKETLYDRVCTHLCDILYTSTIMKMLDWFEAPYVHVQVQ
jgi:hypothetical protein